MGIDVGRRGDWGRMGGSGKGLFRNGCGTVRSGNMEALSFLHFLCGVMISVEFVGFPQADRTQALWVKTSRPIADPD